MKKGTKIRIRHDNAQNYYYAVIVDAKKHHKWKVRGIDATYDTQISYKSCFKVNRIEELLYF